MALATIFVQQETSGEQYLWHYLAIFIALISEIETSGGKYSVKI